MIKRGGAYLVGEIKGRSGEDKKMRIRGAGPWRGGLGKSLSESCGVVDWLHLQPDPTPALWDKYIGWGKHFLFCLTFGYRLPEWIISFHLVSPENTYLCC